MDILEDLRTTTFSNNEAFFKKAACEIEQLRAENAALKEQVAHWESQYNQISFVLDSTERDKEALEETIESLKGQVAQLVPLVSRYSKKMKDNLAECLKGQETITQQADVIKQLRIEADFNFDQYQDAGRLMFELQAVTEQQAEVIRLKDEALKSCERKVTYIGSGLIDAYKTYDTNLVTTALATQPSPEILQARDERIAEAIITSLCTELDSEHFVDIINSGEWRKYL